ncbi:cardiolipin synthase [Priestia filamentosa]|uniref:cardiolipin synthase n=1 Tax=Priestia filamentosa TaxID=1402861 RepID=UPI001FB3AADD|nr:cardiolipin synthase [Priestia filamentosa]UOE59946.1 cardiolipin synthase [Priestia filamentosa]
MKNGIKLILFVVVTVSFVLLTEHLWNSTLLGILSVLMTISVIFISILISLENRHPNQTITWLVVLGSFPLFGFIFYIFFGRNVRKRRLFEKKGKLDEKVLKEQEGELFKDVQHPFNQHEKRLFHLAHNVGKSPISFKTETETLTNGTETFATIINALYSARHHIHLEYYIVRSDKLGNQIKEILIEKALQGVKVRFLYDAVGSFKLKKKYIKELVKAGVEMVPFLPVTFPLLTSKVNFRNHRKLIIVDGSIGFVGGLNIGEEYLGHSRHYGFWRDTHLKIRGEGVRSLQLTFLQDWYYMTGEDLLNSMYLFSTLPDVKKDGGVQIIAGGPDREFQVIKQLFFSMITTARESVWIASPYFIPDEDIVTALKVASLSGVDVRILTPKRPDKKIVFYASRSYFPELMGAGVKIYEYEKGFLHSKIIIVDHEIASIGTANMDMRSFHLNFEVNAFLYKTGSTQKLVYAFLEDFEDANHLESKQFAQRSLAIRLIESACRLLSPLL